VIQAVAAFDPFAPGSATTLVLFGTRIAGMLLVAPAFSATLVPRTVRVGLLVMLTVLLQPAALASLHAMPVLTATSFVSETLIGFAIGLGVALLVGAAETAGDLMAVQMGLSGASLLDPLDTTQAPVLGTLTRLFATTLLLTLNFHYVMLPRSPTARSAFPLARPSPFRAAHSRSSNSAERCSCSVCASRHPVIAAVMIANVALAVLGRAAPQLNILTVAFPLQITIGLFALLAALPAMARFFEGWGGTYDGMMTHVARGLSGALAH